MKHLFLFLFLITHIITVYADCMGSSETPDRVQMEVVQCIKMDEFLLNSNKLNNYTENNLKAIMSSAKLTESTMSIIEAIPIADVEFIEATFQKKKTYSIGRVEPIKEQYLTKFQLKNISLEECNNHLKGVKAVFTIFRNPNSIPNCCRDLIIKDFQETSAECATDLPLAYKTRDSIKQ